MKKIIEAEWPEFARDRERISHNSNKYANKTITEAFADYYGVKLNDVAPVANETPRDLRVGEVIPITIRNISKNHVEIFYNTKSNLMTTANLFKYERFKHFHPKDPVDARVTSVSKDRVIVDIYGPMLDQWLNPILSAPYIQKNLEAPTPIKVKNLRLSRGGFIGDAVIPSISNWVGEDYTIEAFIPGSQIVLNIADDFEEFVGKEVEAFVVNYIPKPGFDGKMSLICSAKEYIKYQGEKNMINAFKAWCEGNEEWKAFEETSYAGKVTGIINSSKKCGVFVEIPELKITGMVSCNPSELVNYKPKDEVRVRITGFDEEMYFNQQAQQMQHVDPYVIKDGALEKCNLKPILRLV